MKNPKKFWSIFVLIVWAPIFVMALWLVIEGAEGALDPFIILCIGSLSIPYFVKNAIKSKPEEGNNSNKKSPSKVKKYFWIWVVISALPVTALGIIDRMKGINAFDLTSLIGIFLGTLCCIMVCYFFIFYLPQKLGLED